MANAEHLKKYQFTSNQSREEAVKNGKKGGIASGISRRNKKTMKEMLEILLQSEAEGGLTYQEKLLLGLINSGSNGNIKSIELILRMINETPKEPSIFDDILNIEKTSY